MDQIVGELVNGAKAVILSIYEDNTGIKEKLDDLDSLVFKIGGTVKLTDKIQIKRNKPLCALRKKLKRTAKYGEDVLREFKNRTNQTGLGDQEGSSSSSSSSAQRITRQFKRWTRPYQDVKRLNETIRVLKKAYVDAKDFHELLKREMSMQADRAIIERFGRADHDPNISYTSVFNKCRLPSGGRFRKPSVSCAASGGELWGQSEEAIRLNLWGLSEEEQQNEGEEEIPQHLLWERNIEERNYKNKIDRMGDLVTRLSILIKAAKRESNDSPWFIPRLAKMTEAVTQGKTALETIKNIPWFIHRCDNLAQRLERMIEDLEYLSELQVLIEAEYSERDEAYKNKLCKSSMIIASNVVLWFRSLCCYFGRS